MPATNPLIAQGVLNRLIASVSWPSFPALNITPPFLSREGIRLALEGNSIVMLPTMTGTVLSKEPYMMISVTAHMLKSNALGPAYKAQMETDSALGNGVVRADTNNMTPWDIYNCGIESVRELDFSGNDAQFVVTMRGYYLVNNEMWNLTS